MALPKVTLPSAPTTPKQAGLGGKIRLMLVNAFRDVVELLADTFVQIGSHIFLHLLETLEPEMLTAFRSLFSELSTNPATPAELRVLFQEAVKGTKPAGPALMMIAGVMGLFSVSNQIGVALMSEWIRKANAYARPERPDAVTLYRALWRSALDPAEFRNKLADIGWPEPLAAAIAEVARPRPTSAELLELWRRNRGEENRIKEELSAQGYNAIDIQRLLQLGQRLLDVDSIIQAHLRGDIALENAVDAVKRHGFSDWDARELIKLAHFIPGPQDLIRFSVREAYNDEIARRWSYDEDYPIEFERDFAKTGGDPVWARRYWRAHWDLPSPTQVFEMLHRGLIDVNEVRDYLKIADYPRYWRDKMIGISYAPLTRVDVRRMYGLGVLNRTQVKRAYQDIGYNEENAELLTQFTVKYEDEDGSSKPAKMRELTRSVVEKAYYKRLLTRSEAVVRLQELRYDNDDIELLLSLVDAERSVDKAPDLHDEYRKAIRDIIEKIYDKKIITREEAQQRLVAAGYPTNDAEMILAIADAYAIESDRDSTIKLIADAYVSGSWSRSQALAELGKLNIAAAQQTKLFEQWDAQRRIRNRRLTEAQYRKALELQIITLDQYAEFMTDLGYSDRDVEILRKMIIAQAE